MVLDVKVSMFSGFPKYIYRFVNQQDAHMEYVFWFP